MCDVWGREREREGKEESGVDRVRENENNDLEEKIYHQELRNIGVEGKKEVMWQN